MRKAGFADIEIKGFDLTGGSSFKPLKNILLKGLNNQSQGEKAELFKSNFYLISGEKLRYKYFLFNIYSNTADCSFVTYRYS